MKLLLLLLIAVSRGLFRDKGTSKRNRPEGAILWSG